MCIARATGSSDFSKSSSCVGASLVKERIPPLRLRSHARHPGALPYEPRRTWRPFVEYRTAAGSQSERRPKVEKFGMTFAIGDKVMQIENDYDKEVYNGNIGFVGAIDSNSAR